MMTVTVLFFTLPCFTSKLLHFIYPYILHSLPFSHQSISIYYLFFFSSIISLILVCSLMHVLSVFRMISSIVLSIDISVFLTLSYQTLYIHYTLYVLKIHWQYDFHYISLFKGFPSYFLFYFNTNVFMLS